MVKGGIKRVASDYGRFRAKLSRSTREFYRCCLSELINSNRGSENFWGDFHSLKAEARKWEENTLAGLGVRSRVQDRTMDEPASIYHAK